jgi:hypothetical protein
MYRPPTESRKGLHETLICDAITAAEMYMLYGEIYPG